MVRKIQVAACKGRRAPQVSCLLRIILCLSRLKLMHAIARLACVMGSGKGSFVLQPVCLGILLSSSLFVHCLNCLIAVLSFM